MKFKATEIGFSDGLGGASNSQSSDEYHYFLFGAGEDEQHPEYSGIYFEYDDQINGGVNLVKDIILETFIVTFSLIDGNIIVADCSGCINKWDEFLVGIQSTFSQNIITKKV